MTVTELYDKLASKEFQDPANSDLFYNFFICCSFSMHTPKSSNK